MSSEQMQRDQDPKRKKVTYSSQLMEVLGYERPVLSGTRYEPGAGLRFPENLEARGWDFVLAHVTHPEGEEDFESKLGEIMRSDEVKGLLPEGDLEVFEDTIRTTYELAMSRLEPRDGLRHRGPASNGKTQPNGSSGAHGMNGNHRGNGKRENGLSVEAKVDAEIVYEFGGPMGTLTIMLFSHVIMYYLWLSVAHHNGNLFLPRWSDIVHIYNDCAPTREITFVYLAFIAFQALLGGLLPGFIMKGLPIPSEGNKTLDYNCNGYGAWLVTLAVVFFLEKYDYYSLSALPEKYGQLMTVMVLFGDAMSIAIYSSGFILGVTHRMSGNHVYDFFMGSWLNPRIGDFDFKLWAEVRVSWFTLFLLTLSCFMKDLKEKDHDFTQVHPGLYVMLCAHFLYTNACVKGEECIVTTWDIFYEKWGWMLIFWNFAGVPIVYTWNSFYILQTQPELPVRCGVYLLVCLLITYYVWDTANSQKNRFRMQLRGTFKERPWYVMPQLPWGTLENPIAIRTKHGNRLLVSGWYGLSQTRKIHYLMDILFALEWGLAAGMQNFLPYFYLCFFSSFIAHRGIRDNERCAKKYGEDWERYCSLVPYVLIPGVW